MQKDGSYSNRLQLNTAILAFPSPIMRGGEKVSEEIKPNVLDKVIAWISPARGFARISWRESLRSAYKGADKNNRSNWLGINAKAEQTNQLSRDILRARAQDLERNSDIIEAIACALERNVVATGFRVQSLCENEVLRSKIEEVFQEWQKPKNCDVTGMQSFAELQQMAARRTLIDGGVLFVKVYSDGKIPLQLQAREVDELDSGGVMQYGGNLIVNGIEVNKYQKPIAYHLREYTPDGWMTGKTERIEAERVYYLMHKKRPSQIREISRLSPTIARTNDIEEYLDAITLKEKVLACLAVFIKKLIPSGGGVGRGVGKVSTSPDYDAQGGRYDKRHVMPGMIMELNQGDDVSAVVPAGQASNAQEMTKLQLRMAGAGLGMSYETVSRDMSGVNYSSARQGLLEDYKTYEQWQQWFIDHLLTEVFETVIESAVLSGCLKIPDFWENKESYLKHTWIEPGWSWIDPIKEVTANKIAIETGQNSLTNICARQGYDYKEILEQTAKEQLYRQELEGKYGVKLPAGGEVNLPIEEE